MLCKPLQLFSSHKIAIRFQQQLCILPVGGDEHLKAAEELQPHSRINKSLAFLNAELPAEERKRAEQSTLPTKAQNVVLPREPVQGGQKDFMEDRLSSKRSKSMKRTKEPVTQTMLPEITSNPLIAVDQWPGKQKYQKTLVQTVQCAGSEEGKLPGWLNRPSKGEACILVSGKLIVLTVEAATIHQSFILSPPASRLQRSKAKACS